MQVDVWEEKNTQALETMQMMMDGGEEVKTWSAHALQTRNLSSGKKNKIVLLWVSSLTWLLTAELRKTVAQCFIDSLSLPLTLPSFLQQSAWRCDEISRSYLSLSLPFYSLLLQIYLCSKFVWALCLFVRICETIDLQKKWNNSLFYRVFLII